jgi:hypothetical protein
VTEAAIATTGPRAGGTASGLFRQPPRLLFHLLLTAPVAALLYAWSFPGVAFLFAIVVLWVLAAFALVWLVRSVHPRSTPRRGVPMVGTDPETVPIHGSRPCRPT